MVNLKRIIKKKHHKNIKMLWDNLVPIYHWRLKENYEKPWCQSMGIQNKCNMENLMENLNMDFQSNINKLNNSLNYCFHLHLRANENDFLVWIWWNSLTIMQNIGCNYLHNIIFFSRMIICLYFETLNYLSL